MLFCLIFTYQKNGFELLKYIKKNHPKIKAIILSNKTNDNYKVLCEKLVSYHFVDKSNEFENILPILESDFSRKKQTLWGTKFFIPDKVWS